jgi:hypothetical protein
MAESIEKFSSFEIGQLVGRKVSVVATDGGAGVGILRTAPRAIEVWMSDTLFLCVPYKMISELSPVGDKKEK